LDKKEFMNNIKAYLKKLEGHLKENSKEDRVPGFKKGATEMIKFIVGNFDKMSFYAGQSNDKTAGLCFVYTKDGETIPRFMFFNDGCAEKSCWWNDQYL